MVKMLYSLIAFGFLVTSCVPEEDLNLYPPVGTITGKLILSVDSGVADGYQGYDLILADSMGSRKIASGPPADRLKPVWNFDGKSVWYLHATGYYSAFYASGWEQITINQVQEDGTRDSLMFASQEPIKHISFSPDGHYLAIGNGFDVDMFEMKDNFKLKFFRTLEARASNYNFWWSPDSKKFVYHKGAVNDKLDLFMYDLEGDYEVNLTSELEPHCLDASWSFSSDVIAFSCENDIYTVHADGSHLENVGDSIGVEEHFPSFSPVENKLVYVRFDTLYDIVSLDLDSGIKEVIIPGKEYNRLDNTSFTWARDGSSFLYTGSFIYTFDIRRYTIWNKLIETIYTGPFSEFDWYEIP
jgi:Tol biopolymer transport system component